MPELETTLHPEATRVAALLSPEKRKRYGTAIIFHLLPTDRFLFFLRDKAENKPELPYPNTICLIGGGRKEGPTPEQRETPEDCIRREVSKEIFYAGTDTPLKLPEINHVTTLYDNRPGEIDVFSCELDDEPELYTVEGQGLVVLEREDVLAKTDFPYNFTETIHEYVKTHQSRLMANFCIEAFSDSL